MPQFTVEKSLYILNHNTIIQTLFINQAHVFTKVTPIPQAINNLLMSSIITDHMFQVIDTLQRPELTHKILNTQLNQESLDMEILVNIIEALTPISITIKEVERVWDLTC